MTPIRRVAIIFDDRLRPETTGVYCRRALDGLAAVTHVHPSDLAAIGPDRFDLYLRVDDGLEYRLPGDLRPSAWWVIDTHIDFDRSLATARDFDFVFAAQHDGAERLRRHGIRSVEWLPLACDPEIHGGHDVPKQYDVAFVGNVISGERADLVRLIERHFPNSFVGQCYFDEMARTYSAARIVFNRSVGNDVNMRVFEALASGSMLMTNDLSENGQNELFRPGVHLETYDSEEELIDKIRYYLAHEDSRERIAAAGRQEVSAKHTYRHRMEAILERVCGAGVSRVSPSPYPLPKGAREQVTLCAKPVRGESFHRLETVATLARAWSGDNVHRLATVATLGVERSRDRTYFDHLRPELLALVPETARRVLDIGCAAGRLGEAIKRRQPAHVTGIELEAVAAADAETRLDAVIVGNIEEAEFECEPNSFDCIVCGDILEHLEDPKALLCRARDWLEPNGRLVASIPNVRHHSVIRSLLDGNWTYEPAGLLDRDHVTFFTWRAIERVLDEAGFTIEQMQYVPGLGYDDWERAGRPGVVSVGRLHVGGLVPQEAEEFYVYQFLVVARTNGRRASPDHVASHSLDDSWSPLIRGELSCLSSDQPAASSEPGCGGRRAACTTLPPRFTQNFISDFDQFDFRGEPFAFVRFGDGERGICEGRRVECQDGWTFDGRPTRFAADLNASLRYDDPGYYIGISDSCCDRAAHEWFLGQVSAPLERLTFANIFVNWNYRRFRRLDLSGMVVVSSGGGDFWVPDDLVHGKFDTDGLVTRLLDVDLPILLAAGPASCVIAHKYWMRCEAARRQTIVDVGSALDEWTKGRRTRQYQVPGTRTAELICKW